ncbi:helix-turn-helix transcriptional regulator [Enterococcus sp. DIV0876]|uniref:helix-turn-helix transcriptional regulator n=1 Tax=Enterococcus sp. DIV0876 TaxID=2774633 RepID=UPI003D300F8C
MPVINRVRTIRENIGLSQGELAEIVGVSRQTINAIETNKYNPSLELALRIAHYFRMPVEDVFKLTGGKSI